MKYQDYKDLVADTLPHLNSEYIHHLCPPDLLKAVAIELFVLSGNYTLGYLGDLPRVTKNHLLLLRATGVHGFTY